MLVTVPRTRAVSCAWAASPGTRQRRHYVVVGLNKFLALIGGDLSTSEGRRIEVQTCLEITARLGAPASKAAGSVDADKPTIGSGHSSANQAYRKMRAVQQGVAFHRSASASKSAGLDGSIGRIA
jgi:hypothetical protein